MLKMELFGGWLWPLVIGLLLALLFGSATGCLQPKSEPIERFAELMLSNVVEPAVAKAAQELSTRTAQLIGGAEVIEPGYTVEAHGVWGVGLSMKFTIRAVGVAARLAGATQADQGPDLGEAEVGHLGLEPPR